MLDFDIDGFVRLRQRCVDIAERRGLSLKDNRFPTFDELREHVGTTKTFEKYVESRKRFAAQNIGIIGLVVKRYFAQAEALYGFEDLLHDGTIGLLRAIDRYEPTVAKFTTYAVHWIRHSIQRALENHGRNVRIPTHRIHAVLRLRKKARQGSITEIEQETLLRWERTLHSSEELHESADATFMGYSDVLDYQKVLEELDEFDERRKSIFLSRYGIDGSEGNTSATAKQFCISRQRVDQIESVVLKRVRSAFGCR